MELNLQPVQQQVESIAMTFPEYIKLHLAPGCSSQYVDQMKADWESGNAFDQFELADNFLAAESYLSGDNGGMADGYSLVNPSGATINPHKGILRDWTTRCWKYLDLRTAPACAQSVTMVLPTVFPPAM